jgi:phosphoglycerol transferase
MVNRENDQRLKYFSVVSLVLFMFATIGGFSSLFAMFVSPSIRAWDRASIFILFASISSFFLYFSKIFQSQLGSRIYKYYSSILLVVVVIGIFDQTKPACIECIKTSRAKFLADRDFVKTIEALLPLNSAIYQMPYIQTLEVASLNSLPTYDSFEGHFHSSNLKWSYGGMNGREGDLFYRALSEETVEKQVEVIKRMGFSGIYIDRRGYKDHGNSVIARLGAVLNKSPTLVRADGERVFFQINSDPLAKLDGLSFFDIAKHAEYFVDRNGPRYTATLAEGIDFRRKGLPMFIKDLKGLSAVEANGRWSDANISSTVKIDFFDPLPNQFTLVITGAPFGPNAEKFLTIRIGTKTHRMLIPTSNFELSLPVNLPGELITSIEFIPPQPTSPEEIGLSSDNRKLGIGFRSIQFEH